MRTYCMNGVGTETLNDRNADRIGSQHGFDMAAFNIRLHRYRNIYDPKYKK